MATMLGVRDDGRRGRAGAAAARAEGGRRRHVQRHHGRRRVLDQRLRVRAGERGERRRARRETRLAAARRELEGRLRAARDRHRPRRRGRDQARHRARHRRAVATTTRADGAGDRELAAREDRDSRRRSELGPPRGRRRPVGRRRFRSSAPPCGSDRSRCSPTARRTTSARRGGRRTCRARKIDLEVDLGTGGQRTVAACGRATSARNTCASTPSTGHRRATSETASRCEARMKSTALKMSVVSTTPTRVSVDAGLRSGASCRALPRVAPRELKAARAAARAARAAARRPARRAAVREAVAPHALDVSDRRARARRRHDRAAGRTSRSAAARRSATSRATSSDGWRAPSSERSRRRGSRSSPSAAPRLRVVNALTDEEHPCQALADCLTLDRAARRSARPDDRVRRRRQQRRGVARAGGGHARRDRADRVAEGFELPAAMSGERRRVRAARRRTPAS